MGIVKVFQALEKIERSRGTNLKKELLAGFQKESFKKDFNKALVYLFDNQIVTGIAGKKWDNVPANDQILFKDLDGFLNYISLHKTGRDEDVAGIKNSFYQVFENENEDVYIEIFEDQMKKFVAKIWTIGIDKKSINEVIPGLIPSFEVQLAEKYWDHIEDVVGKEFSISQKLDGFCTIVLKKNGNVSLWSRSGKQIEGFPEIEKAARDLPYDNFMFHGERMPIGFDKMDSKEQFKRAQESSKKGEKTGFCIAIYDWLPIEDWEKQSSNILYSKRYAKYMAMLKGNKFLVPLSNLYIGGDTKQIKKELNKAKAAGAEGVMVKLLDGVYQWKRSDQILKVKVFEDADCEILDVLEGKGRLTGKAGSFIMRHPDGFEFQCGSGLTDEIRNTALKNKKKWIGKIAEVVYFEKTKDKFGNDSVRFPTYKVIKDGN